MREIPKSWNKEDAFESIKGNDKHKMQKKIAKIQEYEERFKLSCNTIKLCLSIPNILGGLFNKPEGPMKIIAEFLTETPATIFSSETTEVDQSVAPNEHTQTCDMCTIS